MKRQLVAIAVLALTATGGLSGAAGASVGDSFDIAPTTAAGTTAPAFPAQKAFWAGVCDMHAAAPAVGAPTGTFPNCIDHPAMSSTKVGLASPLAPGVAPGGSGPDGWALTSSGIGSGRTPVTPIPEGPNWRLQDVTVAAGRADASTSFWFSRAAEFPGGVLASASPGPDGSPRDITVGIPPGVVGNPNAVPKCPAEATATTPTSCPPKTQIGVSTIHVGDSLAVFPVYNVEPRDGNAAEFIISRAGTLQSNNTNVPIVARVRTEGDFGIDAMAIQVPAGLTLTAQSFTIWAVPWARSHDRYRPVARYCGAVNNPSINFGAAGSYGMPVAGLPGGFGGPDNGCSQEPQSYDPSWGPIKPFFTTQTDCSDATPTTQFTATNWHTSTVATAESVAPQLTDCASVPFDGEIDLTATSARADGPTGLGVELSTPQNNDPPAAVRFDPDDDAGAPAYWKTQAGRATAHLDKTVVTLPEGMSVNPAGASGLEGCSDAVIGLTQPGNPPRFNNEDPFDGQGVDCPDGSRIGTAEVDTPLLDEPLTGDVVLGMPKSTDPQSGDMFRLFIVLRDRERGLLAKVYGSSVADPATGRLTATFDRNPQVPFSRLEVKLKGGDRGLLALPQRCNDSAWSAELTPWSGNPPNPDGGAFATNQNCAFGFAPALRAGMSSTRAGGGGDFTFSFSREDGQQWFRGLTTELPQGLLASVKDVPLCTNGQADAGACPAGSRIGTVDAGAGSGLPYFLEKKGTVYLTEGYKGGEYGLAVVVPVEAGPFRGDFALKTIVVRQALHVDRGDASVTAVSDPFPEIWHGIPLRIRQATVQVDRPGFMRNPTDCAAKQILATLESTEGAQANLTQRFQVNGCAALPFKPRLSVQLTGKRQVRTGKHPGVKAKVTQLGGEAGVDRAVVRLPKSLALDPDNAQALCEFVDGTKPEPTCPQGSIVGRARATSPLLNRPLVGNVYFVKNVRRDSRTGNLIRTLPMLIVALRGEIAVNLKGESATAKDGRLINTFNSVPDAPIGQFNLNIAGGRAGILTVTATRRGNINLCSKPKSHIAEADFDGQNGKAYDRDIRLATPCRKAKRSGGRK